MPPAGSDHPIVIVSNRGPISFGLDDDGSLVPKRGAGGLVSGLGPLVIGTDTTWIAAAISDGDRAAAAAGPIEAEGFRVQTLAIDPVRYRMAYDVVCNAALWFTHHHLFDLSRRPRFDHHFREAWAAYVEMNHEFADCVVESAPEGATVLVQDYHLTLLGPRLRQRRPDVRTVHFAHTPFAGPDALRVLPDDIAAEMLHGLDGYDACGFHTERWAASFRDSCRAIIGRTPFTFVSPLAPDREDIVGVASGAACDRETEWIAEHVGDRKLIVRVDRIELSKNVLRGFHAYDDLLERFPAWRGKVVFGAFVYPSREGLPEYLAYRQECETLVARINERWGTDEWTPIIFDPSDNFPRSIAALRRYDVLLVNPIRDGLNLVAKEGALVNETDGVLLLSPEAGAWAELGDLAIGVNPFDVATTADRLDEALRLPGDERAAMAAALKARAEARTPSDWLHEQLAAVGR